MWVKLFYLGKRYESLGKSPMNLSLFHMYSQGIVAENASLSPNAKGEYEILVVPIEVLNMLDGDIRSNPTKQSISGTDASGRNYTTSAIHDNAIVAVWYNMSGDNRITAPNVRRGERVRIYRYGDSDKFYWVASGQDNKLRKLETVAHAYSATTDNSDDTLSAENSYYSEVSTHEKRVTFSTSKKNGEVAAYTVQIDAANGFVHIQDDAGQVFELDTQNNRMTMTNAQGSQVRVDKQNISIVCSDTLAINATNAVNIQTKDLKITTQTMEVNASQTFTATTQNFNITATQGFKCDTPEATFTGNVSMKSFTVTGDGGTIQGAVTFDSAATFEQGLNSPTVPIQGPTKSLD
jgi:phage gp45-like